MSRSTRKPFYNFVEKARQMKSWKRSVSKRFRKRVKLALKAGADVEVLPLSLQEVSNIWSSPSDGSPKFFVSPCRFGFSPDSIEETKREDQEFLAKIKRK